MKISIVSISAKNIHKMLAPWCLKAYAEQRGINGIEVIEANINNSVGEIVGKIYNSAPDILGFSCYIWNIDYVKKIGEMAKKLLPYIKIILGGPEVSFEENLTSYSFADHLIRGAGERAFFELISAINQNRQSEKQGQIAKQSKDSLSSGMVSKVIDGCMEDFTQYPSPFTSDYFSSFESNQIASIQNQLVYYESSRGCPFSCSYCLSSTIGGLSYLPLERVKNELLLLIKNGAKCIKFVDRTFNSHKKRACEILEFVLGLDTDCTFHFEAAADLFDEEQLKIIQKMPKKRVQFEIGIQSINPRTLEAIDRKTDIALVLRTISTLTSFENCHVHVDLIAGLPFDTTETLAEAVDACIKVRPHMLQLGFLKMLNGTKIRHQNDFGEIFASFPPYEVYQTSTLSHADIITLKKVEAAIEKFYNTGAFAVAMDYTIRVLGSAYLAFYELAGFIERKLGVDFLGIKLSLKSAYTLLLEFLSQYVAIEDAQHHIKLDCMSIDPRQLPDAIAPMRNKQAEQALRENGTKTNIRVEFFPFDNTQRLFDYQNKNQITNRFCSKIL